jgi:hypothetical protein
MTLKRPLRSPSLARVIGAASHEVPQRPIDPHQAGAMRVGFEGLLQIQREKSREVAIAVTHPKRPLPRTHGDISATLGELRP